MAEEPPFGLPKIIKQLESILGQLDVNISTRASEETLASSLKYSMVIDFSREWHKYLFNWEEVGGELVDYTEDGISPPSEYYHTTAMKITLDSNQTKYLHLPSIGGANSHVVAPLLYLTGDVKATLMHGHGTDSVLNVQDKWANIIGTCAISRPIRLKLTAGSSGGNCYLGAVWWGKIEENLFNITSYPNQSLDGSTTYYYVILATSTPFI